MTSVIGGACDPRINLQKMRHTQAARAVRAALFRWIVGPDDWPIVFRAPATPEDAPSGVSANLYVHLPFCRRICPHCPYNKTPYDAALHRAYGAALDREMRAYLARPDVAPIESLYFGGGTPSATPDLIAASLDLARPCLLPGADVGVEVHPTDATPRLLGALREMGVNRVSLGVECFDDRLLALLGRTYTAGQAQEALRTACAAGFGCVDANLIYAIPGEGADRAAEDARRCLALGVDQVSAYPLLTFLHTPLGRRAAAGRFPACGDRARLRAQKALSAICRTGGLARTSVWSFTRPGIAPYSTVTHEDYVGFGAGAGSKVGGAFWFNTFSVPEYVATAPGHPALCLRAGDRFRRAHWLYWQIYRTEIDSARYRALFGRGLERDFGALLRSLALLGFARRTGCGWRLTESGAIWVHRIQALFSLTFIDDLWERCRDEAWPKQVVLS